MTLERPRIAVRARRRPLFPMLILTFDDVKSHSNEYTRSVVRIIGQEILLSLRLIPFVIWDISEAQGSKYICLAEQIKTVIPTEIARFPREMDKVLMNLVSRPSHPLSVSNTGKLIGFGRGIDGTVMSLRVVETEEIGRLNDTDDEDWIRYYVL